MLGRLWGLGFMLGTGEPWLCVRGGTGWSLGFMSEPLCCVYAWGRTCVWKPELQQESRQAWKRAGQQQCCERCRLGMGSSKFAQTLRDPQRRLCLGQWEVVMEAGGVPGRPPEQYEWAEPFSLLMCPLWPQPQRAEAPRASRGPVQYGTVWEREGGGWRASGKEERGAVEAPPRPVISA